MKLVLGIFCLFLPLVATADQGPDLALETRKRVVDGATYAVLGVPYRGQWYPLAIDGSTIVDEVRDKAAAREQLRIAWKRDISPANRQCGDYYERVEVPGSKRPHRGKGVRIATRRYRTVSRQKTHWRGLCWTPGELGAFQTWMAVVDWSADGE